MSRPDAPQLDRVWELLADRAVQGLSDAEARELDRALASMPGVDTDAVDLAAAAGDLAFMSQAAAGAGRMPAALRARVEAEAMARLEGSRGNGAAVRVPGRNAGLDLPAPPLPAPLPAPRPALRPAPARPGTAAPARGRTRFAPAWAGYSGWAVAAVLGLASAAAWWPGERRASLGAGDFVGGGGFAGGGGISAPTPAQQRERLLAQQSGQIVLAPWVNPADQSPQPGDVVWDNAAQEGYLRLASLPVNDPAVEQYQLWIIDPQQQHPIDGGVFDVPREGEVVVPIHAKLRVSAPAAFAVTVEKPGGVVVSDRNRLPLLAVVPDRPPD